MPLIWPNSIRESYFLEANMIGTAQILTPHYKFLSSPLLYIPWPDPTIFPLSEKKMKTRSKVIPTTIARVNGEINPVRASPLFTLYTVIDEKAVTTKGSTILYIFTPHPIPCVQFLANRTMRKHPISVWLHATSTKDGWNRSKLSCHPFPFLNGTKNIRKSLFLQK